MRSRRKKSEMPFAEALEFAKKRLSKATKERDSAAKSLAALDAEIPSLQATISVLEQQLGLSKIGQPANLNWHGQEPVLVVPPVEVPWAEPTEEELLPEPEGTELVPE